MTERTASPILFFMETNTNTNTKNPTTLNIHIVRADGSWRFNGLVWKVGDDRAHFASGCGFVLIADMYREGCEMKEGWINEGELSRAERLKTRAI